MRKLQEYTVTIRIKNSDIQYVENILAYDLDEAYEIAKEVTFYYVHPSVRLNTPKTGENNE